jgi:hypothetical protein
LRDDAQARLLDHRVDSPVRLRAVASGLMIEKVRSTVMDCFFEEGCWRADSGGL